MKPINIQYQRLSSLIEFTKQTALLDKSPVKNISQHKKEFCLLEEEIRGLPGITFNCNKVECDEIWFCIDRLRETPPPIPEKKLLKIWIDLSQEPNKEPSIKDHVIRQSLIDIGALTITSNNPIINDETVEEDVNSHPIKFKDFDDKQLVKEQFKSYIEEKWKPWATKEKENRKSIKLYSELFMLSQKIQDNLANAQLELVLGVGIALWKLPTGDITYPLLTQLVEISLNKTTMSLEIRPRSSKPQLEVDIYESMYNPSIAQLLEESKKFFESTGGILNPFDPSTFKPLLNSAVTHLDSSGTYWPSQTTADDRSLPKLTENLVITDTWVILARPRTNNMHIQDLERFENKLSDNSSESLSDVVLSLLTEPSSENKEVILPPFRGLSMVSGSIDFNKLDTAHVSELYFPMPYNDEQVKIIQMLEAYNGVVVQGPPGTGKTHTIANVICHYLASGKRVLVTSMKSPALTVLQEKIPKAIRPLTISLLTSEAEDIKQFDFAIEKISTKISLIDPKDYRRKIEDIDKQIDSLHARISKVDKEIENWANLNLNNVQMDEETITPNDIAKEVADNQDEIKWFTDILTIEPIYKPQFGKTEITKLREARQAVNDDLAYLSKHIPNIDNFPSSEKLLQIHQDLVLLNELKAKESDGTVPNIDRFTPEAMKSVAITVEKISSLKLLLQEIDNVQQTWISDLQRYLRCNSKNKILDLFLELRNEIVTILGTRTQFLLRPVILTENFESSIELVEAVNNLSQGKKPFGLIGMFKKTEQKRILNNIILVGSKPSSTEDWKHIFKFIKYKKSCRELLIRWNTLANELFLPQLSLNPEDITEAEKIIKLYDKISLIIDHESQIKKLLNHLFSSWTKASQIPYTYEMISHIEIVFQHYLQQYRLIETRGGIKESFLNAIMDCEGEITEQIREFLNNYLGNSKYNNNDIQAKWSLLMEKLRKIHSFSEHFKTISNVTQMIEASGAKKWAERLRNEPYAGTHEQLLPNNWHKVWRLCRLANFIDKIDARKDLKWLSKLREELELDLANLYKDAVNKRTWLKIAENATPDVRSALEAYRAAVNKIGKGTGVRAVRYRRDARIAAEKANNAIPCWIMPHYRICESLPSNFGEFDLVIIDEASQSDLMALSAILRAKKILVVGDDKQVSPEGIGLEEEKIKSLMTRFLSNQVDIYRSQMTPERSIYDLFKVVFAKSSVMLREHFRCVSPIIEYSKREFYNNELKPLRVPKVSERIDPPLIDVYVTDGYRKNNINLPEAQFIVDEIQKIVEMPNFKGRTIGIVSLLGNDQALKIMQMLNERLEEEVIMQYKITCGDARTFQGKERDIIFLSMVVVPGQVQAQTKNTFAQRFNVAASRARDRMYLVRSINIDELSKADQLRSKLIQHFKTPFIQDEEKLENFRELCESPFEREMFDILVSHGYRVIPQVRVGTYRIDMVVEGESDSRLAIECDGDKYHGPEQWANDIRRQRILERAGWKFWRCFASTFNRYKKDVIKDLLDTLTEYNIYPSNTNIPINNIYTEYREVTTLSNQNKGSEITDTIVTKQIKEHNPRDINATNLEKNNPINLTTDVVEIGDLVHYIDVSKPNDIITVQIIKGENDFSNGVINESCPLAKTLLEAGVNDEKTLHLPGKKPKTLKILEIHRPS
ncbi:AAA domain-containing protein [Gilliamella mensalis]|uniref:AAA domain-containing protein n=1 Tax=Gilliamella mensalis TaxID=1908520 RepID=UPI000A14BEAE|nr:AAA domain-containing protein [Gilliamella mensalis]